jgi:hypothetical protein
MVRAAFCCLSHASWAMPVERVVQQACCLPIIKQLLRNLVHPLIFTRREPASLPLQLCHGRGWDAGRPLAASPPEVVYNALWYGPG